MNKNNYDLLKQNFKFILLKRDINKIEFSDNRPLSSNKDDYLKLLNAQPPINPTISIIMRNIFIRSKSEKLSKKLCNQLIII